MDAASPLLPLRRRRDSRRLWRGSFARSYAAGKIERPGKRAAAPSSSSMRSSWLYLAMRSVRDAEPVLIWPAAVATARSAMNVSSVSPERCEMIEL